MPGLVEAEYERARRGNAPRLFCKETLKSGTCRPRITIQGTTHQGETATVPKCGSTKDQTKDAGLA